MTTREEKLKALKLAAENYAKADKNLEVACGDNLDPIACTVFAYKNQHLETLPPQSLVAADYLREVVQLHESLVFEHKMDTDVVRAIWFPILNGEV